jgi:hypothetical protein
VPRLGLALAALHGRVDEYDQPRFHITLHLIIAAPAALAALGLLGLARGRGHVLVLAAGTAFLAVAQTVEILGAAIHADPRNPGADGSGVHMAGVVLTSVALPLALLTALGASVVAVRRRLRQAATSAPAKTAATASSSGPA